MACEWRGPDAAVDAPARLLPASPGLLLLGAQLVGKDHQPPRGSQPTRQPVAQGDSAGRVTGARGASVRGTSAGGMRGVADPATTATTTTTTNNNTNATVNAAIAAAAAATDVAASVAAVGVVVEEVLRVNARSEGHGQRVLHLRVQRRYAEAHGARHCRRRPEHEAPELLPQPLHQPLANALANTLAPASDTTACAIAIDDDDAAAAAAESAAVLPAGDVLARTSDGASAWAEALRVGPNAIPTLHGVETKARACRACGPV